MSLDSSSGAPEAAPSPKSKPKFIAAAVVAALALTLGASGGFSLIKQLATVDAQAAIPETLIDLSGVSTTESAASMMHFRRKVFAGRPAPTPPPPPPAPVEVAAPVEAEVAPAPAPAAPAGSVTEIIYAAADEFGVDRSFLLSIADCESGLNPNAVNPAGYHGLFQFATSTWASQGYGDNIYDPVAQSRTAARMISEGGQSAWANCL